MSSGYAYIMKMFHDITDRFGNHFERWQSEREMYLPSDEFGGQEPRLNTASAT